MSHTKAQFRAKFDHSIAERMRLLCTIAKKRVPGLDDVRVLLHCAGLTLLITIADEYINIGFARNRDALEQGCLVRAWRERSYK